MEVQTKNCVGELCLPLGVAAVLNVLPAPSSAVSVGKIGQLQYHVASCR